jgi:ankyrin repeat protein
VINPKRQQQQHTSAPVEERKATLEPAPEPAPEVKKSKRLSSEEKLYNASCAGEIRAIKALLSKGISVNTRVGPLQETPLMGAIDNGQKTAVKLLMQSEPFVNAVDSMGSTCLMRAAVMGDFGSTNLLLKAKADVAIVNGQQWTAIMIASSHGHSAISHKLVTALAGRE